MNRKNQAIKLVAQTLVPEIVKLAKANLDCTGWARESSHAMRMEVAVDAAMDAYDIHRVLMEELANKIIQMVARLAQKELRQYKPKQK
jgi:hypothetical protein